jgi:hypothetical protein
MKMVQGETAASIEARLPSEKRIVLKEAWHIRSADGTSWVRGDKADGVIITLRNDGKYVRFLNPDFNDGPYIGVDDLVGDWDYDDDGNVIGSSGRQIGCFDVAQDPSSDVKGFDYLDGDEGLMAFHSSWGAWMCVYYDPKAYAELHGLGDVSTIKLQPDGKPEKILRVLASADQPVSTSELRAAVGGFNHDMMWRLMGHAYGGKHNIPLVAAVSRGKYEITDFGMQALNGKEK